jgi:hypothetical protein
MGHTGRRACHLCCFHGTTSSGRGKRGVCWAGYSRPIPVHLPVELDDDDAMEDRDEVAARCGFAEESTDCHAWDDRLLCVMHHSLVY